MRSANLGRAITSRTNGSRSARAQPAADGVLTYPEFRARWSDDEKAALHAARAASWQIDDYIGVAQAANLVDLGSDEAVAAKAAIIAAGVLTHDRGDVIFAAS